MSRTASAMAETICPPHIEGRHPMLYFNIQSTEKYSIAMCYEQITVKYFLGGISFFSCLFLLVSYHPKFNKSLNQSRVDPDRT